MIRRFLALLLFVTCVAGVWSLPALADEEKAAEKDPLVTAQEDSIEKTHGLLAALMQKLSKEDQAHFFRTYNNYNLIGTAELVRGDVEDAIRACGKNNPDMKTDLDTRFKAWDGALKPVLEEAQGHLDNMVAVQDYAPEKEINAIFKSIDDTRKRSDDRFDKVPVTTPEACTYLLGKMNETEAKLLSLLRSTLVTYAEEAEAEAEAEEEAPAAPAEAPVEDAAPADL